MLGDSGMIGNYYFFLRDYEESLFLIDYLSPSDTFVDIGSNLGHYTLLSSGLVGARTICIEPVNETLLKWEKGKFTVWERAFKFGNIPNSSKICFFNSLEIKGLAGRKDGMAQACR